MRRQLPLAWAMAFALLVSIPGLLFAQGTYGRLVLVIEDENGEPIEGAQVIVTCDEMPQFKEQRPTNKKGKVTLAFRDATKVYKIEIRHEGYAPIETVFKPEIRKAPQQTVALTPTSGAVPAAGADLAGGETRASFTPAERVFNEGVEALRADDYEGAKERFLAALEKNPEMVPAYSALGGVLLRLGDHQGAIAAANSLLELEPDNPRGYRILYEAYGELGDEQEADRALEALAELDSGGDAAKMIFNEGVEALEVGDRKAAKERFREALELDPQLAPALDALAVLLINEGSYEDAAAAAERLLALEPDNLKAMRISYEAYRQLGDADNEAMAFDRLAAANPKVVATQFFDEGVDLFNSGDTDDAVDSFERALRADASLAKAHYYLGLCYTNLRESSQARDHLQTFVELAPDDPDAAIASEMLAALGN